MMKTELARTTDEERRNRDSAEDCTAIDWPRADEHEDQIGCMPMKKKKTEDRDRAEDCAETTKTAWIPTMSMPIYSTRRRDEEAIRIGYGSDPSQRRRQS